MSRAPGARFAKWRSGAALTAYDRLDGQSVTVDDRADIGMIELRLGTSDAIATAGKALGFGLPETPRTSSGKGDVQCLWFSIDHWIVVSPRADVSTLIGKLEKALENTFASVADVSDMRTVLRVHGGGVKSLLMKSTSVDVLANEFRPGHVRRVSFGEIAAAIHVIDDGTIDLYVFRSCVEYALDWITEACGVGTTLHPFTEQEKVTV